MNNLKQKFFNYVFEGWIYSPMGGISFVAEGRTKVKIYDEEQDKNLVVTKEQLLRGIDIMATKWPKGCTPLKAGMFSNEKVLNDWLCASDSVDYDAFIQLAIFGEVVYG